MNRCSIKKKYFFEIPGPKKPLLLPKVLGEEELGKLFKALINKKHTAVLFTACSAGLRVGEVAALKIKNIDSDRMQIIIENAKDKKIDMHHISVVLLDVLRQYIKSNNHVGLNIYLNQNKQNVHIQPEHCKEYFS
ncbi:MAG: tyrosine-type recombinase/integrase [Ginsengibacter sp.]